MRPSGANRLMRIGWSAVRMPARHGERRSAAQSPGAPDLLLLAVELLLEKHGAAEMAIFRAFSALLVPLPRAGLQECVRGVGARFILGGRRWAIRNRNEIEVRLTRTLIDVRKNVGRFDPALGFLEIN